MREKIADGLRRLAGETLLGVECEKKGRRGCVCDGPPAWIWRPFYGAEDPRIKHYCFRHAPDGAHWDNRMALQKI